MGLELRKGRNGKLRKDWYARLLTTEGKGKVVNLKVKWHGTPPPSLREAGDERFEASRDLASARYKELQADAQDKENTAYHSRKLIQIKTGRKVEYVKLADLAEKWRGLGRENQPSADWLKWCDTIFGRFAETVPCEYLHEVTREQSTAYVEALRDGFTRRTANGAVALLRSAFTRFLPLGVSNPFGNEIARKGASGDGDTIHRRPLTADELARLFDAARPDPFIYPLTVCAALTGMRIGDVCLLRWQSVDLRAGVVAVKTSKTGAVVEIPIFQPLRDVLETALAELEPGAVYVWPDAARMYKANRYGITYRGKALFARTLIGITKDAPKGPAFTSDRADLSKILPYVSETVRNAGFDTSKRDRILDTLTRYARGQSYGQIEKETGRGKGQTSEDIGEAEKVTGLRLRRGLSGRKGTKIKSGCDIKTLIAATRQKRWEGDARPKDEKRLSASLLGWHALRGTWATLALSAGIPVETVKLVTGHGTANTVLKFYYNPQREHLRTVLGDKLPDVLTGGKPAKQKNGTGSAALPESNADRVMEIAAQLQTLSPADRKRLAIVLAAK